MVKCYYIDDGIPTLSLALVEHMNADELKVLASLTKSLSPTRKAELVDHTLHHLEGDRLRTVWQCLDDVQKALKAFVPPPADADVKSLEQLPTAYDRPFERWNARSKKDESGTESVPLLVRESERPAQRELLSVLRLVDAGKVSVSDDAAALYLDDRGGHCGSRRRRLLPAPAAQGQMAPL
jgi:hypothetical protein